MADNAALTESTPEGIFFEGDEKGWLAKKLGQFKKDAVRIEAPPFPRYLMIETTNICNHSCVFCAYKDMDRAKRHINADFFYRITQESYDLGAREVALFSGAEPFTCKNLVEYTRHCRDIGYEYIYITTNGSLATPEKISALFDAGLSSIKFSVNGGDRETYRQIHGKDDFDKVISNVQFAASNACARDPRPFVGVSFVEVLESAGSYANIKDILSGVVDEILHIKAHNQSGQMAQYGTPDYKQRECNLPFNRAHVTREGYLRACCNDYENALALADLNSSSLMEAWHGTTFRELRRRHLNGEFGDTLCHNCLNGGCSKVRPLDAKLSNLPE